MKNVSVLLFFVNIFTFSACSDSRANRLVDPSNDGSEKTGSLRASFLAQTDLAATDQIAEISGLDASTLEIKSITYTPDIVEQGAGAVVAEVSIGVNKNFNSNSGHLLFQVSGITQEECTFPVPVSQEGNYKIQCTLSPKILAPIGPRSLVVQLVGVDRSVVASANSDNGYSVTFNPDLCGKPGAICVTNADSLPGSDPIQDAINVASAGDTVFVGPGNWGLTHQLNINKSINLVGDIEANKTSIYPLNQDMGIVNVTSSNVLIVSGTSTASIFEAYFSVRSFWKRGDCDGKRNHRRSSG